MISSRAYSIMGILNATSDSFSGDGILNVEKLVKRGISMIEEGADMLDVGGESSAPYSKPLSADEVTSRVVPVIEKLRNLTDKPIAIDTYHTSTARAAIDAGADIINDITGLCDPDMIQLVLESDIDVIIMHMQGMPGSMQDKPCYRDVVSEVASFLNSRFDIAVNAGIKSEKIILDPGIGFGKTLDHNLSLIGNLDSLRVSRCRMLLGVSRKTMIGQILETAVDERLEGSLAAAAAGVLSGADIIRVHDVQETWRFMTVFNRILGESSL
ncbi:dihydropteroate synthase [bacterium]|nr:dihydropteroate synthase [bacterium]